MTSLRRRLRGPHKTKRDTVGLILSGGGSLGAMQVGAVRALLEAGVQPDLVVGTSVGALNGTFLAFDPTLAGVDRLTKLWLGLRSSDLFPDRRRSTWARWLMRGNGVFDNSGIERLVSRNLGSRTFEETRIPLAVVATDLMTGKDFVLSSGGITEALLASTALPGVYRPVEIDGATLIDGGVSNNVPIEPAVEMGATTLYVIDSTAHTQHHRELHRPLDFLVHAFSLARAQRVKLDARYYAERVNLVVIPSPALGFYVPFDSFEHAQHMIDLSYRYTQDFLTQPSTPDITPEPFLGRVAAASP